MINVVLITPKDDLETLAAAINKGIWDEENDLGTYTKKTLLNFFEYNKNVIFLACYIDNEFAGMASGIILLKSYDGEFWLFLDEIDVAVPHRRKGVGKALLQEFMAIGKKNNCSEVWLGADIKNKVANEFYLSQKPDEAEEFIGYTFKV